MTAENDTNKLTKVRLVLYASGLRNVAGAFKGTSDPFAVVTLLASDPSEKPRVLGKTEVIKNCLSPQWTKYFDIDYEIGRLIRINIGVYDEIRKSGNKPMGSVVFEIGEVLGARGNTKGKKLRNGGTVFARVTAAPTENMGKLHCVLRGVHFKNVDGLFSKSDPFFVISAQVNSAGGVTWQPIYRSKHIDNDLNPKWEPFSVDMARLCGGDLDKPIQIHAWDWEKSGKHNSLGSFESSVNGLVAAVSSGGTGDAKSVDTSKAFICKRGGKPYGKIVVTTAKLDQLPPPPESAVSSSAPSGGSMAAAVTGLSGVSASAPPAYANRSQDRKDPRTLKGAASAVAAAAGISRLQISQPAAEPVPYVPQAAFVPAPLPTPMAPPPVRPKFVDYLTGGCELELCIAIDFTGSNGDPRRPGALHYIDRTHGSLNDYEKALTAVGSIIARYDSDQRFPVWGFGAKYGGVIQHCFQVGNAPELSGMKGVLDGYRGVFHTGLTMSGPTVFAEVIGLAAAKARSAQDSAQRIGKQAYKILLILTDGAVSDVNYTRQALQAASDAPLSIVIVGIGQADFSPMRFLDNFQEQAGSTGRDICQFVEFNKFKHDKSLLTRETLSEIPDQLVDYFYRKGITPLPPVPGSQISLEVEEFGDEDVDLTLDMNSDGEISLANPMGAVYDDTKYETYGTVAASAPTAPAAFVPQGQKPYQPTAPSVPAAPVAYAAPAAYAPQAVATAPPRVFNVRVPAGIAPGMQLQVQNPETRANMVVTVPQGVHPGAMFAVRY